MALGADPRAEIHVFTDGSFTLAQTPEMTDPRLHWVGVGQGGRNVAITNLSVRKTYYGSFEYQAFVSLVNAIVLPSGAHTGLLAPFGRSVKEKESPPAIDKIDN